MRIYVANIHRCKHGSDSESYDRRGRFRQSQFESILEDYSTRHNKDALSFSDALAMIRGRRDLMDPFGWFAFMFEWGSTYMLLWPTDGEYRSQRTRTTSLASESRLTVACSLHALCTLPCSLSRLLVSLTTGYMQKDDILGIFDGSIFVVLAHRHKAGRSGGAFKPKKA